MTQHVEVRICHGDRCRKNMSKYILERAKNELKIEEEQVSSDEKFLIGKCICQGQCEKGPNVKIIDHQHHRTYILNSMDPLRIAQTIKQIRSRV